MSRWLQTMTIIICFSIFSGCTDNPSLEECEMLKEEAVTTAVEEACDEGYNECISNCENAYCEDACEEGKTACENSI